MATRGTPAETSGDRERKGAFYTPQRWVALSQRYLAEALGEGWQQEYYVWDCAAGTGNLLAGLTESERIFASTLDLADIPILRERFPAIPADHLFQFDFLNDSLQLLPAELRRIVESPERRRRLLIYINPPYAEAGNRRMVLDPERRNKAGVSTQTRIHQEYRDQLGLAVRELTAQFLVRIIGELEGVTLALFSTQKYMVSSAFVEFRHLFRATFCGGFSVPARTFENVAGSFPIAFCIWDTASPEQMGELQLVEYDARGRRTGMRVLRPVHPERAPTITRWVSQFNRPTPCEETIGYTGNHGPDFSHNRYLQLTALPRTNGNGTPSNATKYRITRSNLVPMMLYLAVRLVSDDRGGMRDREQFLAPPDGRWAEAPTLRSDALAYMLLSNRNGISARHATNHWIPFTEGQAGMRGRMASYWMVEFIAGTLPGTCGEEHPWPTGGTPITFSEEAQGVLDAGLRLWRYYHAQPEANPNASLYDIRAHFQGFRRTAQGRATMNPRSEDLHYMELLESLRAARHRLAEKIAPKVYEYGFLRHAFQAV